MPARYRVGESEGPSQGGGPPGADKKDEKKQKKKKFEARGGVSIKKRKKKGPPPAVRIPAVFPTSKCKLRLLKLERIKDSLAMEEEFIKNQDILKPKEEKALLCGFSLWL